jgi:hypothetical protein
MTFQQNNLSCFFRIWAALFDFRQKKRSSAGEAAIRGLASAEKTP